MEQLTLYHNNSSLKTLSDYMDANRITGISVDNLFDFQRTIGDGLLFVPIRIGRGATQIAEQTTRRIHVSD